MRPSARSVILALVAAACTPAPLPSQPPSVPSATPAAPPAAPETAAPAVSAAPAPPPPEAPSPFFPAIVHGHRELRFFPSKSGGVAVDDDWSDTVKNRTPMMIDDHGAHWEPRLFEGVGASVLTEKKAYLKSFFGGVSEDYDDASFHVDTLTGDWPRSAALGAQFLFNRTSVVIDYTWRGSSWSKGKLQAYGGCECCGGIEFTWRGRALNYNVCEHAFKGRSPLPAIAPSPGECRSRLFNYNNLLTLASGDLLALSRVCNPDGKPGAVAVERWARGATTSVVEVLPGSDTEHPPGALESHGIHALSPTDVYAFGNDYTAHHDGKAWSDVSGSFGGRIQEMWTAKDGVAWARLQTGYARRTGETWEKVAPDGSHGAADWHATAPDGSFWAKLEDGLWHLSASGAWDHPTLPRAVGSAESVAWTGAGTMVVIAADDKGQRTLLLGARPEVVLDLDQPAPAAAGAEKKKPASPAGRVTAPSADCKSLFVVLYRLSRAAPLDYDFPLTRAALKGHTELSDVRFAETEDGGQRYLVAFVPTLDRGRRVLDVLRDKVPGAQPQLLCGAPSKTRRTLAIDLRTGALVK